MSLRNKYVCVSTFVGRWLLLTAMARTTVVWSMVSGPV